MKTSNHIPKAEYLFLLSPYLGILLGMYVLTNALAAILIYHAGIVISLIIFRKRIRRPIDLNIKSYKLFFAAILICALAGPALLIVWESVKLSEVSMGALLKEFALYGNIRYMFCLYFSTVHPLIEELFWRYLFDFKHKYLSLSDVLFGAYHGLVLFFFLKIEFVLLCVIGLIIAGRFWRFLKDKLDENLVVVLSHAIADFSIVFTAFFIMIR